MLDEWQRQDGNEFLAISRKAAPAGWVGVCTASWSGAQSATGDMQVPCPTDHTVRTEGCGKSSWGAMGVTDKQVATLARHRSLNLSLLTRLKVIGQTQESLSSVFT